MDRYDFASIAQWVKPHSKVLDLGCGDGALLRYLGEIRNVRGYGVEIDDAKLLSCIKNGINVIQADIEHGLADFESQSFDYVILSLTLQAMHHTELAVREMLRVGRQAIVSFPNFGYWNHRWQILLGRMPVSINLPYQWFNTPNIHLCTIDDFEEFCRTQKIRVLERVVMRKGEIVSVLPNLLGNIAMYRIELDESAPSLV